MRVSIIIPVFNRSDLIVETLETIRRQTRPADEVILVDDGSTDDIERAIMPYRDMVHYVKQTHQGPAAARNRGLRASTGDVIQFFDSDDLMSTNKIEAQILGLEASGADMAYSPWARAELAHNIAYLTGVTRQQKALPDNHLPIEWYLRGWVTIFQTCLFRRYLLERAGLYNEKLMPTEDSELLFRILSLKPQLVHVPDALVVYRVHAENQISSGSEFKNLERARDWLNYKEIVLECLERDGAMYSEAGRARWRYETSLARSMVRTLEEGNEPSSNISQIHTKMKTLLDGLRRRFSRRLYNHCYGESALSPDQTIQFRELGYEPRAVQC